MPSPTRATVPRSLSLELKRLGLPPTSEVGLSTELARAILPVALANLRTLDRKQLDYGSRNLTDFGVAGVIVRLNDKMARLINLHKRQDHLANGPLNEPIADTLLDLSNYALIAHAMLTKTWPKS